MSDKIFGIINNCKRKAIITQWKSWGGCVQDVWTGGENKDLILELRKLDKKTQRAEYDKIKYQLPLTTAPNFKDNHCTNANYLGNTWMPLDIDNLTSEQVISLKAKLSKLPYVICCYVSCGGHGLRVIIRTPFMADDAVYKTVFAVVEKEINAYLGLEIDTACKDSRRLSFDSYDPDIYYNPDATQYEIPDDVLNNQEAVNKNDAGYPLKWDDTICEKPKHTANISERIYLYIDKFPAAVSGQGGSNKTLEIAVRLLEGFGLSIPEALPYMAFYNRKCNPPWTEKELLHKLEDAEKKVVPAKSGSLNNPVSTYQGRKPKRMPAANVEKMNQGLKNGNLSEVSAEIKAESELKEWPEPENILAESELLPVLPFDTDLLPNDCDKMTFDTSHRKQTPPEFTAVPQMIALSSTIAYKINIRPKQQDSWTVVCNLWGVIIGSPSLLKTPCTQEALKPLKRLEALAKETFNNELKEYAIDKKINDSMGNVLKKQAESILRGSKEVNKINSAEQRKQQARSLFEESVSEDETTAPIRKRYILGDSTTEKRQELQTDNKNRGLLIFRDELAGLIYKLDSQGKENDRAYYLESWAGDSNFINDTIGRGTIEVPNNTLSIIGTSQPNPWRSILSDTVNATHKDDGFPQRFQLAVYPDTPEKWLLVDERPNYEARQSVYDVFDYLDNLDPATVEAKEDDGQYYLNFSYKAQEIFNNWWTDHENWLRADDELPPYLISHFSKYRSLVPSIALIIHLANRNIGSVEVEAIEKAIKWSEYLKSHAYRLYGTILTVEEQTARLIASKLLNKKLPDVFSVRDLYRKHWAGINKDTTETGLEVLQEAGWGRLDDKSQGNKPSLYFTVNKKIFDICNIASANSANTDKKENPPSIDPIGTTTLSNIQKFSLSGKNEINPLDMSFLDDEVGI